MKSLFNTLFALRIKHHDDPLEDYLTELFAFSIQTFPELFFDLLKKLGINSDNITDFRLETQKTFKKINKHTVDSQPDIVIYFGEQILFIENKINSGEGGDQLKRYAEHIQDLTQKGVLLYLTKNHDKKDENIILENCSENILFKQLRWFEIVPVLKKYQNQLLIKEILRFMKNKQITTSNNFNPSDIITLSNFSRVKKIIDNIMDGAVSDEFERVTGGKNQKSSSSMTQLTNHDRYVYFKYLKNKVTVYLGFWMQSNNEERDYPDLNLIIEVAPSSSKHKDLRAIMKSIIEKNNDWWSINLEFPKTYAQIGLGASLQDFLSDKNHVNAIQKHFIKILKKFETIKNEFGELI